jgi:hypothetical protein
MYDLLVVALQADVTRVATLVYGREGSNRSFPELGFTDSHHPITHHRNLPDLVEKVTQINVHHVEQFAYFVNRLKSIQDGDGTLLDHSMRLRQQSERRERPQPPQSADGRTGRGNGQLTTGRHVVYPDTPMTNLYLTLLDRMGVPAEKLGDSNGKVEHLSDV